MGSSLAAPMTVTSTKDIHEQQRQIHIRAQSSVNSDAQMIMGVPGRLGFLPHRKVLVPHRSKISTAHSPSRMTLAIMNLADDHDDDDDDDDDADDDDDDDDDSVMMGVRTCDHAVGCCCLCCC
eukprot:1771770-Rhodomonas_salina.4